jgi:hypothetical protein
MRHVSFGYFPETIAAAKKLGDAEENTERLQSEDGIEFRLRYPDGEPKTGSKVLLTVLNADEAGMTPEWLKDLKEEGQVVVLCEPRGIGATRWTRKNGPNYVERSHVLLGRTVDAGRVWDVVAAARYLAANSATDGKNQPIHVAGKGSAGLLAAYAAVLDDVIASVKLVSPPATHMESSAPQFLNVLRVCDVPDALGLIAPRPLTIIQSKADSFAKTKAAYLAAGAGDRLKVE